MTCAVRDSFIGIVTLLDIARLQLAARVLELFVRQLILCGTNENSVLLIRHTPLLFALLVLCLLVLKESGN